LGRCRCACTRGPAGAQPSRAPPIRTPQIGETRKPAIPKSRNQALIASAQPAPLA
jgi:hypothetical protein